MTSSTKSMEPESMGFIRAMERRWKAKDAMSGAFYTGDSALASFWFTTTSSSRCSLNFGL